MKELIIIGARGFGRVVCNLAKSCDNFEKEFVIKGFLDDKFDALNEHKNYPPILGAVETYQIEKNDVFVCALGEIEFKRKYSDLILRKGGEFISLIHPMASISQNVKIGKSCLIFSNVIISCDVNINDFITILPFSLISHNSNIGNYSHIGAKVFLGGYCNIEDDVSVQTGAIILPNKKIEKNASVGAGSVVIKNVKENSTVFGNPAREI